jgi:hypothetical protein
MSKAHLPAESTVLLWALTVQGEINATYCEDLAEAERFGRLNVSSGAWRTWDAFELLPDGSRGRILVSSHGNDTKATSKRIRARIIPD